jgi:6-phosphogluconolactonase
VTAFSLNRRLLALATILVLLGLATAAQEKPPTDSSAKDLIVHFGTYTNKSSKGIYVARLNPASGALTEPALAAETPSPSYLALHPSLDVLYAVNEINEFEGKPAGSVSAFAIDRKTGLLTALNRQSTGGSGPAHLSTDRKGAHVFVANYGGGSVAALPIAPDGSLRPMSGFAQHTGSSVNAARQKAPHAHSIDLDPSGAYAYVADLGIDKVLIYRYVPAPAGAGTLTPAQPPFAALEPGSGPRHLAFHPSGRFAYVINEIVLTVTAFARDAATGALTALQTISTLPEGVKPAPNFSTAEVLVHPSGRFLYGSNRGHDSITVYSIDQSSGRLAFVQNEPTGGATPRAFGIDPTGRWLLAANQGSDSVVVFGIDGGTGRLSRTATRIAVGAPVSVTFLR